MAAVVQLPSTDSGLQSFAQNMSTHLTASPTSFGCTTSDATSLASATADYVAALSSCDPAIRTRPAVVLKNTKGQELRNLIKLLALKIQGTPTVTDTQKASIGLALPNTPTPIPAPSFAPAVDATSVNGRTVELHIHDSEESRRGKPPFVAGAMVFSFVGTEAPADPAAWKGEGITTRTRFQIVFPATVPAGAQVWITAQWYNSKAQTGPAAVPITTYLQGGGSVAEAA
jgi:hypothetical protein